MVTKTFSIRFKQIDVINKSLELLPPEEMLNIQKLEYKFNYKVDVNLQPEAKAAIVLTEVTVITVTEKKLACITTICMLEFPEFEDIFIMKDGVYQMPIDLEILLKSAGLSTTRGLLYSELKGTYLHNAILPLIDLATQIKAKFDEARKKAKKSG